MALGGVPGLEGMGLDGMGIGTPMGGVVGSVSGLGLGVNVGGEEAKRRKLEEVMEILKADKGRLSEAGVERLAKRVGLECFWEDHVGSGKSIRTLIIAGSALALDIDFENNVVKKVALSFPESPEIVTRHTEAAGNILLRDLEYGPGESPLTKKLDRFAANLERLAMLDKLSVIPGLNCHEAIAGIYESIERLHLWEVERLKESEESKGKGQDAIVKTAMYTKSGKPAMHVRDRLGMSLDYWREDRQLKGSGNEKTYALLVECAPLPSLDYPSVRVSEHWISADILKPSDPATEIFMAPGNGPLLDWLQPEHTLLPSTDQPKVDAMEGIDHTTGAKFNEVMFVAKFDPPLVVTSNTVMQVYSSTGVPFDQFWPGTYDELLFPRQPDEKIPEFGDRELRREVTVPVFNKGEKLTSTQTTTLFVEKSDYGRTLTEIPFSHPQQLVEWLPILRQAAFLGSVLQKTFGTRSRPASPVKAEDKARQSLKREFNNFMSRQTATKPLRIDVKLDTQPVPRLGLQFPFKKAPKGKTNLAGVGHVVFEIKPNAVVEIVSENILQSQDADVVDERKVTVADLARMLELTEDIGVWVEYVKRRLA